MKKTCKTLLALLLLAAALWGLCNAVTPLLTPKRYDYGCLWQAYEKEDRNSIDVMFFGSSIAYCDVIPAMIYQQTGLTSYTMAGPTQTMPQTYYYIRQALETQSPATMFVEVTALFYPVHQEFDAVNIGYMPNGWNKWRAMAASTAPSTWIRYLLPLYNYHYRWSQLQPDDYTRAREGYDLDPLAGYTYLPRTTPFPEMEPKGETYTAAEYEKNEAYLLKIRDLCAEKGIRLVLYLSPRCNTLSQESQDRLTATLEKAQVSFVDFDTQKAAIGLDPLTDYYDRSHLNAQGAEKFTQYLSDYLENTLVLTPQAGHDNALWQRRIDYLNELRQQTKEAAQ